MSPFASFVRSGVLPYLTVGTILIAIGARSENTRIHAVHADSAVVTIDTQRAHTDAKLDSVMRAVNNLSVRQDSMAVRQQQFFCYQRANFCR